MYTNMNEQLKITSKQLLFFERVDQEKQKGGGKKKHERMASVVVGGGQSVDLKCFCCSEFSREHDDNQIREKIIPFAPKEEWNIHWDVNRLLPETGSKDITSYFVLKDVFLFLPFHLDTLLSVAATCRAWRVLSDNLP